jgi:hypothetical protein
MYGLIDAALAKKFFLGASGNSDFKEETLMVKIFL